MRAALAGEGLPSLDQGSAIGVRDLAQDDQDDVNEPPKKAAAQRKHFQDAQTVVAEVEAVHAQEAEENRQDQRHDPAFPSLTGHAASSKALPKVGLTLG